MALLGYARVSTLHQSPEMQIAALREAGAERIWIDQMSGTRDDRPELASLLDYARRGDVLMVWRLDRLGRSLRHLLAVATDLHDRGVELRSLTESVDTTTTSRSSSKEPSHSKTPSSARSTPQKSTARYLINLLD
ncbi:site-specific DNA recombinase [Mycolicibacterium fortuitum subsp. acetamidolyticum]|uniref:Site-specific DNA recombinase n=1 Tax=Mycolicibacterium fortuitum subsp. acetamidolyticum TaxID=144550 RepID=A0A100WXY4_MYCFO|nr:recombinase family protein [Mycolicibacterium fortuitum]MCV7141768.1 recombinase family protein [Mycolicibacterium fortuitum]GAT06480.1 site-specific DNA recombinase [Mycolicibacterium fortuitum subsp. acetamidolyticum]